MPKPPFRPFKPAGAGRRKKAVKATQRASPEAFPDKDAAGQFLFQIILPPSLRWSFISVGKSASTSTLHALYEAEFGHPLTADLTPLHDINPDAAIHTLPEHGIFGRALHQGLSMPDLLALPQLEQRICVVRDPLERAISGFRYICKSHHLKARWFARERFEMDAAVGFDWDRHTDTVQGFERFLAFLAWQMDASGVDRLNGHWRPQTAFIKPEVYRPTLIGRMEDVPAYFKALSAQLGAAPRGAEYRKNPQADMDISVFCSPAARRHCAEIFAPDYEAFEYASPLPGPD
ncbi:sulfotransferase family 2 domain-containing protein [uncultured Tateyamaria sp.]|uniref:sulfotransferase family 2 domain-containing protein n=1 Tax=uncultured Tateyamaria sp. TaxID=455651 RepID=UPI00260B1E0A|nr:sulfotransferase family 2 domain-containing protein [uncultured Tateyamaria sp.]